MRVERGQPTPPIAFAGDAASATAHLDTAVVAVDDALFTRLEGACAQVSRDAAALAEASRDWWPLAMIWALDNQVAARGCVLARPGSGDEVAAVLRVCNEERVPVTAVAGRSGVCGGSVPLHGASRSTSAGWRASSPSTASR